MKKIISGSAITATILAACNNTADDMKSDSPGDTSALTVQQQTAKDTATSQGTTATATADSLQNQ